MPDCPDGEMVSTVTLPHTGLSPLAGDQRSPVTSHGNVCPPHSSQPPLISTTIPNVRPPAPLCEKCSLEENSGAELVIGSARLTCVLTLC